MHWILAVNVMVSFIHYMTLENSLEWKYVQ